jgi:UTP-glucose-1-phosphate uridylyltransferase
MSAFERLLAIASGTGEVLSLAREIIGKEKLAVLLAKSALIDTSETLSATKVAEVLGMSRNVAAHAVANATIRNAA